jgi:molybdenum cofactor guanylyltransferase
MLIGAVLCGGQSRRMGTDKAFIEIDGVPMVQRVAAAMRAAGCDLVYAVGGDGPRLRRLGFVTLADLFPHQGPLGGIVTALQLAVASSDVVLVVACDMPRVDPSTLSRLVEAAVATDAALAHSNRLEPLCAAWRGSSFDHLLGEFERGTRAVHVALEGLRVVHVPVADAVVANLNTPSDLPIAR